MNDAETLAAIRARHRRVCACCGGAYDDSHRAIWGDCFRCACGDEFCPTQLLDAEAARHREVVAALVEALDAAEYHIPERAQGRRVGDAIREARRVLQEAP